MSVFIVILIILTCIVLMFLVLIQNSKGGGLVSTMQSASIASQKFGTRKAGDVVEKATWIALCVLVALTFVGNIVLKGTQDATTTDKTELKLKTLQLDQRSKQILDGAVKLAPEPEKPEQPAPAN